MKLFEVRETHEVHFQIASALAAADLTPAIQMETRAAGDVGQVALRDKFLALNAAVKRTRTRSSKRKPRRLVGGPAKRPSG